MGNYTKTIIFMFIALLITMSFWTGARWGFNKSKRQLSKAETEILILKTKLSSQEWYIADEKRKNAAFAEVIEIETER